MCLPLIAGSTTQPPASDTQVVTSSTHTATSTDVKPDVTSAAQLSQSTDPSTVSSATNNSAVLDIANPQTFQLGQGRQRITKADFFAPNAGIKSSMQQSDDPFSGLDPMWSIAGQKK